MNNQEITNEEVEKKAFEVWIKNKVEGEKRALTMGFERFTDSLKQAFCEIDVTGMDNKVDELILQFSIHFFEMEKAIQDHIDNSNMARVSLNERMKKEIENSEYLQGRRILS
jgi:hypothetical protein